MGLPCTIQLFPPIPKGNDSTLPDNIPLINVSWSSLSPYTASSVFQQDCFQTCHNSPLNALYLSGFLSLVTLLGFQIPASSKFLVSSIIHYHVIEIWKNGLTGRRSKWWTSIQSPSKMYPSNSQACCCMASSQYYNPNFPWRCNREGLPSLSVITLAFFAGQVCCLGRKPQLYSQDSFWKNYYDFYILSIA